MEITVISEAEQIEFQTLAFHHLHVRQIAYAYFREVRLSGDRTKTCKLRAVETYPVIVARMLVHESFEHLWRIIRYLHAE